MRERLRVLLVEDSAADAERLERELRRGGYDLLCRRVESREQFQAALTTESWDIVLSDYALPAYTGLDALADLRSTGKDVPFILVSGSIGEALAVTAMKAGAQDYVLKEDLTRLPAAVAREVREAAVRADRARTRDQLLISERMASTGMLAAGVAHEINNPLAVAVGNVDLTMGALDRIASDARSHPLRSSADDWGVWVTQRLRELEEPLQDTREALQRIRDIVRDVKLFSRGSDEKRGSVDVQRVIDSSIRMAWNEVRHRARVVKRYDELPLVDANESRIGQVVLNLIINAAHAIPEGDVHHHEIRVVARKGEDGDVVIEIADTGCGIPPENMQRIFEPFFTTKPVGVGTGLGLAICRRIVTELGGRIEVESEVGRGTTVRVVLPAAKVESIPQRSAPPLAAEKARVLVIDDEVAVGRAVARSLAVHHDVVVLDRGAEALARIGAGERFDVIVCDLMMPELSGKDLYERLQAVAPEQAERVVFLTGGAFTQAARAFLESVPNPRVEKPIELANLLAIISGIHRR